MLSQTKFSFLNDIRTIDLVNDWFSDEFSKLWIYNLHYFDDLNAKDSYQRVNWHRRLINQWIAENPVGHGPGWESYPLSIRITNWIKWALSGNKLDEYTIISLTIQVRYLANRLEYHLLGNHLFTNAKALVFAGCFFDGDEADNWLRLGVDLLDRELQEQILADGGHFERSTMYHSLIYEDMLDLINLVRVFPEAIKSEKKVRINWVNVVICMGSWLAVMCHPDGEISFFNDSAIGIAPSPNELFSYAVRLGFDEPRVDSEITRLEQSGYIRLQIGRAVLLVDIAPLGPDYQPGHGHADTLSFELSLDNQRVIVNSGTSLYDFGTTREWERSTAAHSTVIVDNMNSSEVWSSFRVARRARVHGVVIRNSGSLIIIDAEHDGYKRLSSDLIHRRKWRLGLDSLEIYDEIFGKHQSAVANYYIHPQLMVGLQNDGGRLQCEDVLINFEVCAENLRLKKTYYAPEFGKKVENNCLQLKAIKGQMNLILSWF